MLKRVLRSALRRAGLEIRRAVPAELEWLRRLGVDTVIDAGANTGQFARFIREVLPEARVYSFEPLPDCHAELCRTMAGDTRFRAFNLALSDREGRLPFRRSSFPPSSSLLPMHELHRTIFPHSAAQTIDEVDGTTLDAVTQGLDLGQHLMIKMDVQGAEAAVMRGGAETFARADVVLMPCSFVELYVGQPLFPDDLARMQGLGFRYIGSLHTMRHPRTGFHLSEDALFVREDLVSEVVGG